MSAQAELHNVKAGEIIRAIVAPIIESGGSSTDILILTESVLVGVALFCIKFGGDDLVLDVLIERARGRLAELRLSGIESAGEA